MIDDLDQLIPDAQPPAKKTTAKKTAAKKPAARKTAAKKTAAKKVGGSARRRRTSKKTESEVTEIAEAILRGSHRWGTGRDRDERLAAAGHDVEAVRKEVYRLRGERLASNS